jgi:hypothetical protein
MNGGEKLATKEVFIRLHEPHRADSEQERSWKECLRSGTVNKRSGNHSVHHYNLALAGTFYFYSLYVIPCNTCGRKYLSLYSMSVPPQSTEKPAIFAYCVSDNFPEKQVYLGLGLTHGSPNLVIANNEPLTHSSNIVDAPGRLNKLVYSIEEKGIV